MTSEQSNCRICGDRRKARLLVADEIFFGRPERFEYFECARCGCVQIVDIPDNLGDYYPADYYSFEKPRVKRYPALLRALRAWRTRARLGRLGGAGKLIAGLGQANEHFTWLAPARVDLDARILDVGCGSGRLLAKLSREGFGRLTGIDPFMAEDAGYPGVELMRASLGTMQGEFDLVMLHHSLEHMPDPLLALRQVERLLAPGGTALVRVPLADSYAFRKYGTRWSGFEAPRHLYLFTVFALTHLARCAGLQTTRIIYDSTAKQFHSELAIRGIPVQRIDEFRPGMAGQMFSRTEWALLEDEARRLNFLRDGDTACFFLQRSAS